MPGSTHELALSADGHTGYGSVYGDGIFTKTLNLFTPEECANYLRHCDYNPL